MKNTLTFMILVLSLHSWAQNDSWFRETSISPDGKTIAFVYKGDIYTVPSSGGEAKAITFHEAHDYKPVWNSDGTQIAFASNRFGNFDVFIVNAQGGEPTRLTFHSTDEHPFTFTEDGNRVIFGAARLDDHKHRQFPTSSQPELYSVSTDAGRVNQIWTIPAEGVQISKDGNTYIYHDKKGGENEFRKHHVSAITRDLWVYDKTTNTHTMLTDHVAEDRHPYFSPDESEIYFLSERSGTYNVHKLYLNNPGQVSQVTSFETHPVRNLSISKNGTLAFTYNGEIYTQEKGNEPTKLSVDLTTARKVNNTQVIPVSGNIREMAVSPNGKEVAYIVRGEIFVASATGSLNKRITSTPGQERFVSFSPDGKKLLYAAERNGNWDIFETSIINESEPYFYASTVLKETAIIKNSDGNYEPKYSPDGKEIAFIKNKRSLVVYNKDNNAFRTLLTPDELFYMGDGDQHFEWSPDSKWLLVSYRPQLANAEVVLLKADGTGSMINLTESGYGDLSPKWVNDGKQMLWFSTRHGMRSYANSGQRELDVYSMFFTQDEWDKFKLSKDEYELKKELEEKEKESKKDPKEEDKKKKKKSEENKEDIKLLEFDWEGMKERKARLTIHSSKLSDAVLSKDGENLYYLARFEKGVNLWETNLRTKETKIAINLNARSGQLQWDKDKENLFLLADGRISILKVSEGSRKPVNTSDELILDITSERLEMFDHVWQRTKDMFYISDFHGVDWPAMKENYRPKVSSLGNDFEFVNLLSEMLGELNVSHSGARYRSSSPSDDQTASLGIFFDNSFQGNGLKITEIIREGPLDKDHIEVKPGMVITSIDGNILTPSVDYVQFLNRKVGEFTLLEILDPNSGKSTKVTIKPISLGQERGLLYDRWVRINEKEVEEKSGGKLAYIHIPGMSDGSYRETYEKVMGKYHDQEALIVDTRFNGGGDLVSDLAMFFTGKKFIDYSIETRDIGYEPGWRWTKPSLAMIGEAQYSDGHCFACGYKDLGIGELVGMPTPGTCSFAGWEMLQNGTVLWGAVPLSAKDIHGNWMENNQTEPTVKVKNMPADISTGRDQQLEKAIEILMKD